MLIHHFKAVGLLVHDEDEVVPERGKARAGEDRSVETRYAADTQKGWTSGVQPFVLSIYPRARGMGLGSPRRCRPLGRRGA